MGEVGLPVADVAGPEVGSDRVGEPEGVREPVSSSDWVPEEPVGPSDAVDSNELLGAAVLSIVEGSTFKPISIPTSCASNRLR